MKKLLLILTIAPLLFYACSISPKEVKLSGVVLFKNSQLTLPKPDKWSKVFILNKKNVQKSAFKNISEDMLAYRSAKTDHIVEMANALANGDTTFFTIKYRPNPFGASVINDMNNIEKDANTIKLVCDENGNFSVLLQPGSYYIVAISASKLSSELAEVNGLFVFLEEELRKNEDKQIKIEFE